jgi:hypothetical protein
MKYQIKKISIDKEAAELLIQKMARQVRLEDETQLDKRAKEIQIDGVDELIDVYLKIGFNSEYKQVDGGIECIERGVIALVGMYDSDTGEEIGYDCPIDLNEKIEKIFWI